jgi:hypothetical protein
MTLRNLDTPLYPTYTEVQELLQEGETLYVTARTGQFSNHRECRPGSEGEFDGFVGDVMLWSFEFYGESQP